jgi:hypothetical protein
VGGDNNTKQLRVVSSCLRLNSEKAEEELVGDGGVDDMVLKYGT